MRKVVGLFVLALLLTSSAKLRADDPPTEGWKLRTTVMERFQDLGLTDEQESRIASVRAEYRPRVLAAAKQLMTYAKEECSKIRGVLTSEQEEQLQLFRNARAERFSESLAERLAHVEDLDLTESEMKQIAEIRKEYGPKYLKAIRGLEGLLTAEQKATRESALYSGKRRRDIAESLNLTAEQKEAVSNVTREVRTLFSEEMEKIRDVLTAEQQEKLADIREERRERARDWEAFRAHTLKTLNLTDDQKNQISQIRSEYRPQIHEAGNKLRAAIRDEIGSILAVLKS